MSRPRQTKKLHPAKKAWRSFSNALQSKIHKLNIPRAIKNTIQRLVSSLHSLASLIPTNSRARRSRTRRYSTSYYQVQHKNFAVRIDDLYAEPANNVKFQAKSLHAQGETSRGKGNEVIREKESTGENSQIDTIEDAWKAVVARSPQLQVDEKAEEFINKFHQDMRLQKEMSLLEFQERLKRSA
ncbi:hypothetical protein L6164_025843 [Bauhinia variegata]|uniref:Uncharacterized protein n=1 Tax=Bauhinia variegata TaxID=167791 RepID=A0ACB9M4T1_BAUVA|nr:hypothetical protein L6164_025843 [Bauhinia variegata]